MKDNINKVFALKSFAKKDHDQFTQDGFLLFPDQECAQRFTEMCLGARPRDRGGRYENFDWVRVTDFIGDRVQSQKSFFVKDVVVYESSPTDFSAENMPESTPT